MNSFYHLNFDIDVFNCWEMLLWYIMLIRKFPKGLTKIITLLYWQNISFVIKCITFVDYTRLHGNMSLIICTTTTLFNTHNYNISLVFVNGRYKNKFLYIQGRSRKLLSKEDNLLTLAVERNLRGWHEAYRIT